MRRIDVILMALGVFGAGGIFYLAFGIAGLDATDAGIWSQVVLVIGVLGWVSTYLRRAATKNMTYVQQLKDYEDAVIQKRYEALTPEELAQLQTEIEQKRADRTDRVDRNPVELNDHS
jgi:membrane protein implicated in regulation of membrane protease activity